MSKHIINVNFNDGLDAPDSPGEWLRKRCCDEVIEQVTLGQNFAVYDTVWAKSKWLKINDATPQRPPQPFPEAIWKDGKWRYPEGWWAMVVCNDDGWFVFRSDGHSYWAGETQIVRLPDPTSTEDKDV